jgi:hypothetical protein
MSDPQNPNPTPSAPPSYEPPPAQYAAPSTPAVSADTKTFLLIGAIGAFATVVVVGLQFAGPMAMFRNQAMLILAAVLGLGGLVGLGVGMMGFSKATGVATAKPAGILLFVCAALALFPLIAMMAKSRGLMQFVVYVVPVAGAAAWLLVGTSFQAASDRLGSMAKLVGVAILAVATVELIVFFLGVSRAIRGRSAAEVLQVVMYILTGVKLVAIILAGTLFLKARESMKA